MATAGTGDPALYCPCSNIVIMQLFHELKQKFPAVPDRVVSECIRQNCHDKAACEGLLRRENHRYLMHSYPMALKMSGAGEDSPPPGGQCERCTKGRDEAPDASSFGPARTQTHFYSSVRETSHVLQKDNNMNRQVLSVVRDTVIGGGEVITPSVLNVNESRSSSQSGVTGSQWFAQGEKSQFLPAGHVHNLPISDSNIRYCQQPQVPSRLVGGDSTEMDFTTYQHPQFQDVSYAGGSTQYQHVESKESNCSTYSQTDDNSNPRVTSSVVNNAQCLLQETHSQRLSPRQCQTRSSVSVQSSSTTIHKHCNRPCALDVRAANMLDQTQPWSAPDMPTCFEPFNHLMPSRSIEFNTPPMTTTTPNPYPSHPVPTCQPPAKFPYLSQDAAENTVNHPSGTANCAMQRNDALQASKATTSEAPPRTRSSLTVETAPHYAARDYWGGGGGGAMLSSSQQPRSYTSVNLTLRPPSLDPLPPIDIHSAGTSLTYSTSSYDPRQGFQSQLQIRIGPGGVGSVSALRTRAPDARPRSCYVPAIELREEAPIRAESLPDVTSLSLMSEDSTSPDDSLREQLQSLGGDQLHSTTQALLTRQVERKNRLRRELKKEKQKLREMQREVRSMEHDLAQRQLRQRAASIALPVVNTVLQKVQCLRQEIQYLQQECKKMTTEVDLSADPHVPLGETDEAFYKNIYTGQRGCVLNRHPATITRRQEVRAPSSPLDALDLDGPNWTCTECTFRNHPLLDKCEQCEMPRIILGTDSRPPFSENCYCHPSAMCDKMCLPSPLTTLPRMIINNETVQQMQN